MKKKERRGEKRSLEEGGRGRDRKRKKEGEGEVE